MAEHITVDSGTTNTRIYFVRDRIIVDNLKYSVGTKSGNGLLRETLRNGIFDGSSFLNNHQTKKAIAFCNCFFQFYSPYGAFYCFAVIFSLFQ